MEKREICKEVKKILIYRLGIYLDCLFEPDISDVRLENDLDMEWVEKWELLKFIAERFNISVEDNVEDQWKTIGDVADYVNSRL